MTSGYRELPTQKSHFLHLGSAIISQCVAAIVIVCVQRFLGKRKAQFSRNSLRAAVPLKGGLSVIACGC